MKKIRLQTRKDFPKPQKTKDFKAALENDLSTPVALSCVQKAVKDSEMKPEEILDVVSRMDSALGLKLISSAAELLDSSPEKGQNPHEGDAEAQEIDELVAKRTQAKKSKDFALADKIRDELSARGIIVTDTPNGPVWSRK